MKTLNWAILGTGTIANEMAAIMQKHGRPAYAVGNRTYEKAKAFGLRFICGIRRIAVKTIVKAIPQSVFYSGFIAVTTALCSKNQWFYTSFSISKPHEVDSH